MTRVVTNAGALAAATAGGLAAVSMRKATAGAVDAARRARVDKGEMRAGIHAEPLGIGARVTGRSDHDIFNEFGTFRMAAQPMFRPSMDAARAG